MKFKSIFTPCFCYDESSAVVQNISTETGFDRVKRMYIKNEYNVMSPELYYLIQNASLSCTIAAIIGAFIHSSKTRNEFFRKNTASVYESQHLARRSLSDAVTKNAITGGFHYAVKYGSFSTAYLFSAMTIANYNNKITIWEHIGTGAVVGGIFRFNFGLKGMAAGASVGGFLGTLVGGVLVLYMKYANLTLEDIRNSQSVIYYSERKERYKT